VATLRKRLKNTFDYEAVYQSVVLDGEGTDAEREALIVAVNSAYETLDTVVRRILWNSDGPRVNHYQLKNFISRFSGHARRRRGSSSRLTKTCSSSGTTASRPGTSSSSTQAASGRWYFISDPSMSWSRKTS
jgi:hypothetical protein